MPMSNYPSGFPNGVSIRGLPILNTYSGSVYWVNSTGGSDQNKGTRTRPFATLDYAVGRCASGDIIMLAPGHAESIASATALSLDVAGITIVGLGLGAKRPTFTLTTANTATIPVSASSISIENCIFIGNFLSIASCFTLAAAPDFRVHNCDFRDTDATHGFLSIVTTTVSVDADGLTYTYNRRKSDATTTPGPDIVIAGTIARLTVNYNRSLHTVATNNIAALIEHGALVVTDLECMWNRVYSINTDTASGAILVKTTAVTGSGIIAHNRIRSQDAAAAILVTAAAVQYGCFDNLHTGDATLTSGFLLPGIGTDT